MGRPLEPINKGDVGKFSCRLIGRDATWHIKTVSSLFDEYTVKTLL